MKINIGKIEKEISFCNVMVGDVFKTENKNAKFYYMKCLDLEGKPVAIDLCTGKSFNIDKDVKVIPYSDAEVIIKE